MVVEFLKRIFSFDPNSPLLFTQFDFWVFFALVFSLFSLFKNKVLLRNTFIFFVSVFFYYKTSGWATIILVSATLLNFLLGLAMPKRKTEGGRVVCLLIGLLLNLGILCYFKYAYFFAEMLHGLFGVTIPVVNVFAEIGKTEKEMDMGNFIIVMVIFMRVSGKIIKKKDSAFFIIKIEQNILEVLKVII